MKPTRVMSKKMPGKMKPAEMPMKPKAMPPKTMPMKPKMPNGANMADEIRSRIKAGIGEVKKSMPTVRKAQPALPNMPDGMMKTQPSTKKSPTIKKVVSTKKKGYIKTY